jgi:adenosyl cobinamide kinase/adenosyl cobinamide phosphate guanylyltransferase
MRPLKIVEISGHACIRVQKQALPLIQMGHDVHLVARKQPTFVNYYKTFTHYSDITQCIESIKLHLKDADIFHVHNEPSYFACMVKELTDKPVVLDVHDTYLTRTTVEEAEKAASEGKPHVRVTNEERNAFQLADALVFVSEPVRDETVETFNLNQPNIVLPSYVPQMLHKYHAKEWMGGLVYEGRVTIPKEYEGLRNGTGAGYCDYLEVAKKASEIGLDFHLYAGRQDDAYAKLYGKTAMLHPGYSFTDLLDQISRHDWGLAGNLIDSPQWQKTLPNKLFDYLSAGVPCVSINASETSKLIEKYGIGITVESIDELAQRWAEHRECRKNLWKSRMELSMDENIHVLLDLYRGLCA